MALSISSGLATPSSTMRAASFMAALESAHDVAGRRRAHDRHLADAFEQGLDARGDRGIGGRAPAIISTSGIR